MAHVARLARKLAVTVHFRVRWALVVAVLAGLMALGLYTADRLASDRAELIAWFAAEREARLADAVHLAREDFADVADDLAFAGQLVIAEESATARQRTLSALLGTVRAYRLAAVVDHEGQVEVLGRDERRAQPGSGSFEDAFLEAARSAATTDTTQVQVSLPLVSDADETWRSFAAPLPDGSAVLALLVDTRPILGRLQVAVSDRDTSLLVVGPHGRPIPVSSPSLTEAFTRGSSPVLTGLVDAARGHGDAEPRCRVLPAVVSEELAVATADLVGCVGSIAVPSGPSFPVVVLASTVALRTHERALVGRLAVSSGIAAAALLAFGVYLFLSDRQVAVLRERVRLAEELRQVQDQLVQAEKLATVGVLSAGIAHEVGTPLGVIRGRAEYILGKLDPDHPQARGLQVIIEQIDRITRTIRALLDFSRPRPALARAVDLPPVVDRLTDLLRYEVDRRRLGLEVDLARGLPPVAAEEDQLQQVLVNLVMNAVDACEPGGRIRIAAEPSGDDAVSIVVSDDGRGIAPEDLPRVQDPFFTTKKRGEGTGLGLAMVSRIVRGHGARIEIESQPGEGTRVRLVWPRASAVGGQGKEAP